MFISPASLLQHMNMCMYVHIHSCTVCNFPQEWVNYLGASPHRSKESQNQRWKEISAVEFFKVVYSPK